MVDGGTAALADNASGGNGGSGARVSQTVTVSPGTPLTVIVGSGGFAGKNNYEVWEDSNSQRAWGYEGGQTGGDGGLSQCESVIASGGKGGTGGYREWEYWWEDDGYDNCENRNKWHIIWFRRKWWNRSKSILL